MVEDYKLIRELQSNGLPDIDRFKCEQVFEYIDQWNGALECRFNEKTLDGECRPNTWYQGTGIIKLTTDMVWPLYYEMVDPCLNPAGLEIQWCSAARYFVELDTW